TLPFLSKYFVPPNRNNERLSTTFFIAAAGFPYNFLLKAVPIPSDTPREAIVPLSSNTKFSSGWLWSNALIFFAHTTPCCVAACAVGGNGRPSFSFITQAQSPIMKMFSSPGARKSPSTVTFPLVNSNPDLLRTGLPVTPPVQTMVPALISSLSSPTTKQSSLHSNILVLILNSIPRLSRDCLA